MGLFSSFIGIYRFADAVSCGCLKRDAEAFIHKHFLKVVQEEEFLSMPKDCLVHLLHSENLHVENEFQVFKGTPEIYIIYFITRPSVHLFINFLYWGWSGGAMALINFQCLGVLQ